MLELRGWDKIKEYGHTTKIRQMLTSIWIIDVKTKVEAASQLRDNLEHYISGQIYPAFLKRVVPIFVTLLKGPPVFVSTSPEQVCKSL